MSLNVLVIPEDFTKDEHILKPLVEQVLKDCGRTAQVRVCRDPNFQGVDAALNERRLRSQVVARYPMVDWFILLVDRDGDRQRDARVAGLEQRLAQDLGRHERRFVATLAHQEVEVFLLAGSDLPGEWSWRDIRAEADVKNTYFRQWVDRKGARELPHEGRKKLMAEAIRHWKRIKSRCPEDVGVLIAKLNLRG